MSELMSRILIVAAIAAAIVLIPVTDTITAHFGLGGVVYSPAQELVRGLIAIIIVVATLLLTLCALQLASKSRVKERWNQLQRPLQVIIVTSIAYVVVLVFVWLCFSWESAWGVADLAAAIAFVSALAKLPHTPGTPT